MDKIKAELSAIVGEQYVLSDEDSLNHYGQDWSKLYQAAPSLVVRPASTEEVARIIKLANEHQLAVVPSGGRTGLSGGACATQGELVLSLERLNSISDFDPMERLVRCGAGVITEQLQQFAQDNDLFYPVDFASAGSSQLGGNIATNAGGIKVLKYGLTRDWVAGLTVVDGSGEIHRFNQGLVKNATGYDLRHLIIGSEGTLGIVTEALMELTTPPVNPTVMLLALSDLSSVSAIMTAFRKQLDLTAFEFFSEQALQKVMAHRHLSRPLGEEAPFYVLIEFDAHSEKSMEDAFATFEASMENGWVVDGTISQSQQQAIDLWQYREGISESIAHYPPYKNDISVRPSKVGEFLQRVNDFVEREYPTFENIWFGHIGDGNLHLNILKPESMNLASFKAACQEANPKIFEILQQMEGSISAEHGVGILKKPYLAYSRSPQEIALMKQIKQVFDPNGILNPGKLLDAL